MFTEFWLNDFPKPGQNHEIYRVTLGELINATERETFKPGWKNPDLHNKSGSIGFMDVVVRDQRVPKENALPLPNPHRNPHLVYQYIDFEIVRALTILDIAIEPSFRRQGYSRLLKQRAEELALEWKLDIVVSDLVTNPIIRRLNYRLGYTLYDRGMKGVKRLKTNAGL